MRAWWNSFGEVFRRGSRFTVPALTGTAVLFLLSAAPAAASESKEGGAVKDPVARSMVDAAEYLCRKECTREHERSGKTGEEGSSEFLECLKRCRGENPVEITGTYTLNGSRSSGDCHDFAPTVTTPGISIEGANGTATFFSNAEIGAPLNADGSFRGEGTYLSSDCTIREIIEGIFARDAAGRTIFTGTRTFEDLTEGCTVSYRAIYTRQQEK